MRSHPPLAAFLGAAALALAPAGAAAQTTTFQFEKPEPVTGVAWTATAQLGTTASAGNTAALGVSGQATLARKAPRNRLAAAADVGIARSRATIASDVDGVPGVGPGELRTVTQTTRQAWGVRARYDRFLTARASLYAAGTVGGDRPSGKRLAGGGQVGYGVDVLSSPSHTLRVEAGYDLTYEDQLTIARPVQIQSARAFAGWAQTASERLALTVSGEVLTNVDEEHQGDRRIAAFDDTRLLGKAALTAQLAGRLSVAMRLSAAWDGAPAPRPPPPGASFEPGFSPRAERLDTTADLVLIATLL